MAIVTSLNGMNIGDKIIAEYTAPVSAVLGAIKNIGTSTASLLPTTPSGMSDGAFYFIKVATDTMGRSILIADRNIQSVVSWDSLNTAGIATGNGLPLTEISGYGEFTSIVYVNCTTGSDTNNGTSGSPVQTLNKAIALSNTGGAIVLSAGVHTINTTNQYLHDLCNTKALTYIGQGSTTIIEVPKSPTGLNQPPNTSAFFYDMTIRPANTLSGDTRMIWYEGGNPGNYGMRFSNVAFTKSANGSYPTSWYFTWSPSSAVNPNVNFKNCSYMGLSSNTIDYANAGGAKYIYCAFPNSISCLSSSASAVNCVFSVTFDSNMNITAGGSNTTYGVYSGSYPWSSVTITVASASAYSLRLLTGGISSSDTYDEWDTYIVNSTLNGTITAGDNNTWNWSYAPTWTSTTNTTGSGYRTARGQSSVGNSISTYGTSYQGTVGYRPVLVFLPQTRFLFQDGSDIKTYSVGSGWSVVGSAPATDAMFNTYGMTDLSAINNTAISSLSTPTLLYFNLNPNLSSANLTITGAQNISYKYKVTSNNASYPLLRDYGTSYTSGNTSDFVMLNQSFFLTANPYTITVTAQQQDGTIITSSGTVQLVDTAPTITSSMTSGNTLNLTVGDNESDQVQYLVKLNGNQVYPATTGYTSLMPSPTSYQRTFKSNEVKIGSTNTVEIDAVDQYGVTNTATLTFTGSYTGIMFSDINGNYYSDDLGNVLKYLDFGSIIAGQTTVVHQVNLYNLNPFSINNINIWISSSLPNGVSLQFDTNNNPFVGSQSINIASTVTTGNFVPFYVRISTTPSSTVGGTFDIYAKASPT